MEAIGHWLHIGQFPGVGAWMKTMLLHIIAPIIMTVAGEFFLKVSVASVGIGFNVASAVAIVTSPGILMGVGLIGAAALLWIMGMRRFQLSFMYPFLSINYVLIVVGSEYGLQEDVSFNRYLAIVLIIIGLVFISKSPHSTIKE